MRNEMENIMTFTQLIIDSTAVDKIIETKDESSNQEPNNGWLKQFQDKDFRN